MHSTEAVKLQKVPGRTGRRMMTESLAHGIGPRWASARKRNERKGFRADDRGAVVSAERKTHGTSGTTRARHGSALKTCPESIEHGNLPRHILARRL